MDGTIWLDEQFLHEISQAVGFEKLLHEIETKFQSKPVDPSLYAPAFQQDHSWYSATIESTRRQMMRAAISYQNPQVLGPPDSDPANQEPNPQTPDKRRE